MHCPFNIANGTRKGGILSPYLFTRYIRELICTIAQPNMGGNIGGLFYNILAYADDIILMAPSWKALQSLIDLMNISTRDIDMLCNVEKSVRMVFNPICKRLIVATEFPRFTLKDMALQFVKKLKYLGHMINNELSDNDDMKREIRNLL